ncbi:DEAD/DEAH box helicase, partial [Aestuariivirga sp.]|uniref:DEAD/DEAH box helicase n=1 Tax=Aestuariivirga sp. TaxID=2650926 RepID=UPI0035945EDF
MISTDDNSTAAALAAIHPALAVALAKQGYATLTPVQIAVIEAKVAGRDLLVSAQTGSGKTVAFGLAIAPTLLGEAANFAPAERPLGLIIAPTRELALQVERELSWLYADAGVVTASCVGGMDMRKERRALDRGAHIVVGTPGRLRDHITKGSLDLAALRAVVLDEADEMLDLGFREDLEFILAAVPETRRTLMFSATVPKSILHLAKVYQRDAARVVATAATERHADIDYQLVVAQSHERENAIINTLLFFDSGSAIVFCHTREAVKHLAARLGNRGFTVVALSGELSQAERTSALQAMRDGRAQVCVATDVAARGIDLPNLDLVIHADMPTNPDILLHRSGRTGRAGRKGVCVLIVPVRRYAAACR